MTLRNGTPRSSVASIVSGRDTLTFVPFRTLPHWFKRQWVYAAVRNKLEAWWLQTVYAVEDAWRAVRGRGS
jgi:hypothetical protein